MGGGSIPTETGGLCKALPTAAWPALSHLHLCSLFRTTLRRGSGPCSCQWEAERPQGLREA